MHNQNIILKEEIFDFFISTFNRLTVRKTPQTNINKNFNEKKKLTDHHHVLPIAQFQ